MQDDNQKPGSKNTNRKVLISIILIIGVLAGASAYFGYKYYKEKHKPAESLTTVETDRQTVVDPSNDPAVAQQEGSGSEEVAAIATNSNENAISKGILLYLDKSVNKIIGIDSATKTTKDYFTTPSIYRDAKISHDKQTIAFIVSRDKKTILETSPMRTLDMKVLKEVAEDVGGIGTTMLNEIQFFSPHDRYVTYSYSGWELCDDGYYSLTDSADAAVDTEWCGSTRWSPSGKRLVKFTSPGIATGSSFSLTPSGDIAKFNLVDWSKVTGDIKINPNEFEFSSADFIDDNSVIIAGRTANYAGAPVDPLPIKICIYNDQNKTITLLGQFAESALSPYGRISDIRYTSNRIIFSADKRLFTFNQSTKSLEEITLDGATFGENDNLHIYGIENNHLIVAKERYFEPEKATNKENKLYLINLNSLNATRFDLNGGSYVGLLDN